MFDVDFIVPYKEFKNVVIQAFHEFEERSNFNLHLNVLGYEEAQRHEFFGDIVIARGLTAAYVKNLNLDIPLVEIPMTSYDVIKAVHVGVKQFRPQHIAFLGTPDMIYGAEVLELYFETKVSAFPIKHDNHTREVIDAAHAAGADLFIGGDFVHQVASSAGYRSVRIDSGKEGVRQALNEALRTMHVRHQERERTERFRTLVENVHEGIVAVDQLGRITVINNDAKRLLRIRCMDCVGRYAAEVIPEIDFVTLSRLKEPVFGELMQIRGTSLTANRIPISVNDALVGHLITFQEVSHIQEIESRIRQKVHQKGLIARYRFDDVIGSHPSITETVALAHEYARAGADILIVGETGTGKELFAQSIHAESERKNGPFVAINCAALPESLLESELFGYVEGAFTGAAKGGKIGLFELAHKGTIFLDEISELPPALQGRLLRVIEERELMRLGHDQIVPVDIRIISATNKDLNELVEAGQFRVDLLYRLDVLRLNVPAIRNRGNDIRLLIEAFLDRCDRATHGRSRTIEETSWPFLLSRPWKGNVRQIRNFCERLSVIAKGSVITTDEVVRAYGVSPHNDRSHGDDGGYDRFDGCEDVEALQQLDGRPLEEPTAGPDPWEDKNASERRTISRALELAGNNRSIAAQSLGIDRSTLWRKMKKLGLG